MTCHFRSASITKVTDIEAGNMSKIIRSLKCRHDERIGGKTFYPSTLSPPDSNKNINIK